MTTQQSQQNSITPTQGSSEPLAVYIRKPEVIERFADALGNNRRAMVFVQSVLILVQNSDPGEYSLQNCSNQSIVRSALRAITLEVSVDPALRQAWLVPRKNKKSGKIEACLQLHYAEVRNRAMRTGRYWSINVSPVYEGETVMEHPINGLNAIMFPNGNIALPAGSRAIIKGDTDGFVPVNSRGKKVIGWFGFSETTRGAMQTVYMSIDDIEKHVATAQSWGTNTDAWKKHRQTMERKTVLLALLRKEDLGAPELEKVKNVVFEAEEAEYSGEDDPAAEGWFQDIEPQKQEEQAHTEADDLSALGFSPEQPVKSLQGVNSRASTDDVEYELAAATLTARGARFDTLEKEGLEHIIKNGSENGKRQAQIVFNRKFGSTTSDPA